MNTTLKAQRLKRPGALRPDKGKDVYRCIGCRTAFQATPQRVGIAGFCITCIEPQESLPDMLKRRLWAKVERIRRTALGEPYGGYGSQDLWERGG